MNIKFSNDASTTLAQDATTSATELYLASGTGAEFPSITGSEYFMVTCVRSNATREIMKVTARVGDVLTVVRAQEGTTALDFSIGDRVDNRLTAEGLDTMLNSVYASEAEALAGTEDTKVMSPLTTKVVVDTAKVYDNTTSGMSATTMQGAVDELDSRVDGLGTAAIKNIGTGDEDVPTNSILPQGVPAGCVMHYFGTTAPDGWLVRDGSAISRTTYAALFAVVGTYFGDGDGSTTFNLPNDLGRVDKGAYDGTSVGTQEADQNLAHTHTASFQRPDGGGGSGEGSVSYIDWDNSRSGSYYSGYGQNYAATSVAVDADGESEVRVKSSLYLPIIKY